MNLALLIVSIVSICFAAYFGTLKLKSNEELKKEKEHLQIEINNFLNVRSELGLQVAQEERLLKTLKETLESQESLSDKAFENYMEILEKQYDKIEKEYNENVERLNSSYGDLQLNLMQELDGIRQELDKMRNTRAAAVEAARRELAMEDNLSFYCLDISDADKADILKLEALKPSLNKSRILSMLIWQTFFQKPLKALAANVVGTTEKSGIYKITNVKTKECYVGQAVNIQTRLAEHAKCGLGIDTPAGNKLYKAMQEYGLWNFSFEVLEECPCDQLNEKEKYYIELYNSKDYGYNSISAPKKI